MKHLTEEQLILHYYGERPQQDELPDAALDALAIEQHLDDCAACRGTYASLQRVLNFVDSMPVPERPANYGEQVWQRIAPQIGARRPWFQWTPWRWVAVGAAMAGLLVTAFVAGRFYSGTPRRDIEANRGNIPGPDMGGS